ncbi:hypothetical protein GCK72_007485 [Caenorhabditis remanei]|uniref:Uncharacterized protein n=1 Tax=Caenorhabditis remanei TaxID=31234 RepID=A0A6A5HLG9_CAERE|nr:hypothetical protein GCK72_007485 [Caenorhabditis remanei]KAF1767526.1 hypothetical protein GCK72_007485 [Caenorhabditis remanei]
MKSIPLQYESLKAVLIHMDANIRFKISQQLPTIRITEKLVPLRVRSLRLDEYSTTVNDTVYQLGIYREFKLGENILEQIKRENDYGGINSDLDQYGFRISPGHYVVTPGDVSFRDMNSHALQYDTIGVERYYRDELKIYEKALLLRTNSDTDGITTTEHDGNLEGNRVDLFPRHGLQMPLDTLKYRIDNLYTELLPFECRRFNLKPPYVCYIQLTIQTGKSKQVQRFPYKIKLYEAMKSLNTLLFGGRRSLILAERFHLPISSIILRLPIGFKVGTRQLRDFFQNDRFDILPSILDSSFFPLDLISIYVMNPNDVQHPIVSSAKTLIIFGFGTDVDERTAIRNCSNQQVVVRSIWFTITVEQMFGNVQYCLENRSIQTCYSYSINDEKTAKELFRLIKTRIDNTKRTKRCVSIKTTDRRRLEVFYIPTKNMQNEKQVEHMGNSKWILKIRTVRF